MFWVSVHEQGCISRPFSVCSEGVFPALTSAPTVYWMLYFRKPFPGLESLCPSGAGSLCQLLGRGNQLFIGSLQSNTCCIPTIPKGFSHIIPATQSLTAGNDKEISGMTVPSCQSETLEKFISLSLVFS